MKKIRIHFRPDVVHRLRTGLDEHANLSSSRNPNLLYQF
jgi:hypothetical protein